MVLIYADEVTYRYEFTRRIKVGYIGCGGHSYRNVLPTFQYAPIDLVAMCDLDIAKARAFAQQFGAERAYVDYHEMLEKEDLDAVFIVTNYDDNGEPRAAAIAGEVLRTGRHVWMEKLQPGNPQIVKELMSLAQETGLVTHKDCPLMKPTMKVKT